MIATLANDTIELPHALSAQGLSLRRWRDDSDYDRMSPVIIASRNADDVEEARTGADIKDFYARTKGFDVTQQLLLMEHQGNLVAYIAYRWYQERDGKFIHKHWLFVLPEWRGRGIEQELIAQSQVWQREANKLLPQDAAHRFQSFTSDIQTWHSRVLEADGYKPVRYFFDMVCRELDSLPNIELPPGIETRPARPEQYRQIWDAEGEAFSEHWGEAAEDESDYARFLANPLMKPELWQVAWDEDLVAGIVMNYIDGQENERYGYKRGYTENISVGKPWRGRGIAKALLVKSMKMFREMGFDHTALGVDAENATGALQLYTSVGYRTIRTVTAYQKPL